MAEAAAMEWPSDLFIVDTEAHPLEVIPRPDLDIFPAMRRLYEVKNSLHQAPKRKVPGMTSPQAVGQACAEAIDEAGVDLVWCSRHDFRDSSGGFPQSSNGQMHELCSVAPDRLMLAMNPGQIVKSRGIQETLWELDYWVREHGCRIVKYYCPDDERVNDERLWPFYKRCEELEMIVCMHIGTSITIPQRSINGHPLWLDDVCSAFPDLRVVAYHMGRMWYREAIGMLLKHENLYATISAWIDTLITRAPWQAHEIIGEALREGLEDKVMWGLEWRPGKDYVPQLNAVWNFTGMPEDLAHGYGYPAMTEAFKRKLLGENAARLLGIDPSKKLAPPRGSTAALA
jgi:predicted TIM-barrel fold metal-dependent hydrolase